MTTIRVNKLKCGCPRRVAHQSGRMRPAILLRRHLGLDRGAGAHNPAHDGAGARPLPRGLPAGGRWIRTIGTWRDWSRFLSLYGRRELLRRQKVGPDLGLTRSVSWSASPALMLGQDPVALAARMRPRFLRRTAHLET